MTDYYNSYLKVVRLHKLLKKEHSAKNIAKKTKTPLVTVYRILRTLEKHNIITIRTTRTKDNKHLQLYKLKRKRNKA